MKLSSVAAIAGLGSVLGCGDTPRAAAAGADPTTRQSAAVREQAPKASAAGAAIKAFSIAWPNTSRFITTSKR